MKQLKDIRSDDESEIEIDSTGSSKQASENERSDNEGDKISPTKKDSNDNDCEPLINGKNGFANGKC